ncbi:MAG: hypothetical protein IMY77_05060 [Chloroflexi bacterium]|nr:hypothetical protein [Chloroflexota bacterium]
MKREILEERIRKKAREFKSRSQRSPNDAKRHDLIKDDERRAHYAVYHKLGWSYAKIGAEFNRDPRTIKASVEKEQGLVEKHRGKKQQRERQLIWQRQKEHIKNLQLTARAALDLLPHVFPDLTHTQFQVLYDLNERVFTAYRRLLESDNWKDLAAHLEEGEGKKIELMLPKLSEDLLFGSLRNPDVILYEKYKKELEEAWGLIRRGGLVIISNFCDTRHWEWLGLNQRCPNCPDQSYEPVDITPDDIDGRYPPVYLKRGTLSPEVEAKLRKSIRRAHQGKPRQD